MKRSREGEGKGNSRFHSPTERAAVGTLLRRVLVAGRRVVRGERELPGTELVSALLEHGPRYAHHLQRERMAWRKGLRADARPHLRARLNLAGAQRGTRVNALLEGLEHRDDIASFDYASLEPRGQRAAELFGQLRLAEISDLYTYYRYFGDFRMANWLRMQLLEAHLRAQERATHVMVAALAAALELGRPRRILEIVDTKRTRAEHKGSVEEVTAMAHAFCGDWAQAEQLWDGAFDSQDRAFGRAVRGRTVAVVGPAPPSADLGQEIDSFDLVVRTNYFSAVNPKVGSRTDISYYNGMRLGTRSTQIRNLAPSLSWVVSMRSGDTKLREVVPGHPGIRAAQSGPKLFVGANPLGITNILSDLLRFRPRNIKLFGVDFFTTQKAYDKTYNADAVGSDAISHSIRVHECFSSFRFAQQLRRTGLIEADAIAEQVLTMSSEQYAARLQELHGHYTVANEHPRKLSV
jgi:hypothetical protein